MPSLCSFIDNFTSNDIQFNRMHIQSVICKPPVCWAPMDSSPAPSPWSFFLPTGDSAVSGFPPLLQMAPGVWSPPVNSDWPTPAKEAWWKRAGGASVPESEPGVDLCPCSSSGCACVRLKHLEVPQPADETSIQDDRDGKNLGPC